MTSLNNIIGPFTGEYRFLSNFYEKGFKYLGIPMKSAEHAYQASKCEDILECACILFAPTPGKAKRLGQKCKLTPNWENEKLDVMEAILIEKFADPELKEKLLATGDADLIEINDWGDTYWGVCEGKGSNYLGKLLMMVREYYQPPHIFDKPNTAKFIQLVYKDPGGPMSFPLDH